MSKLSFRARALDASKPMPIYMSEELPDLPEYSAINRAVPQMPSGMEKEEECEHHLQRAIVTGLIIPTPEVTDTRDSVSYERCYAANYKLPRQLIHMEPFTMEQDIPDYDMDSEDEQWVSAQAKSLDVTPLKFEEIIDRLEKNSGHSVVTQLEAKLLLKEEDDDLIIAVYDYWLNKRLKTQTALIPNVRTEAGGRPVGVNNPYVAFRRRTEKMQTRKNRKNDETSYGKMVKLRKEMLRSLTLLELIKRRENSKRELLHLNVEIYEKRYQANDLSGQMLEEVSAQKSWRPAFAPIYTNQLTASLNHTTTPWPTKPIKQEEVRREKRQYKKRKHKAMTGVSEGGVSSGEEETAALGGPSRIHSPPSPSHDHQPFAFNRNKLCSYHAPVSGQGGNWAWCSKEEGGQGDKRYRYCMTSISHPEPRCIGYARRRIGRGGRVILDRSGPWMDDFWKAHDYTIYDNFQQITASSSRPSHSRSSESDCLHFRPLSPTRGRGVSSASESDDVDVEGGVLPLAPTAGPLSLRVDSLTADDQVVESTNIELDLGTLFPGALPETPNLLLERLSACGHTSPGSSRRRLFSATSPSAATETASGGSLLDRWARFESSYQQTPSAPSELTSSFETFTPDDVVGCSSFRTVNSWQWKPTRGRTKCKEGVGYVNISGGVRGGSISESPIERVPTAPTVVNIATVPKAHASVTLANGPVNNLSETVLTGLCRRNMNHNTTLQLPLNSKLVGRAATVTPDLLHNANSEEDLAEGRVLDKQQSSVLVRKNNSLPPMEVT